MKSTLESLGMSTIFFPLYVLLLFAAPFATQTTYFVRASHGG